MADAIIRAYTRKWNGIQNVLHEDSVFISNGIYLQKPNSPTDANAKQYKGIWDTGASSTAISKKVVVDLGLTSLGKLVTNTANGSKLVDYYPVNIWLPNGVVIENVLATECDLIDLDFLIGMDIIGNGDFSVSNFEGKTVLSFRVPSVTTIDYVQLINSQKPQSATKVGRNDLCPCGSGKKFKHCHGR